MPWPAPDEGRAAADLHAALHRPRWAPEPGAGPREGAPCCMRLRACASWSSMPARCSRNPATQQRGPPPPSQHTIQALARCLHAPGPPSLAFSRSSSSALDSDRLALAEDFVSASPEPACPTTTSEDAGLPGPSTATVPFRRLRRRRRKSRAPAATAARPNTAARATSTQTQAAVPPPPPPLESAGVVAGLALAVGSAWQLYTVSCGRE